MKNQINKAIMAPIAGFLGAGILGTIAGPEIVRASGSSNTLLPFIVVMLCIALVFGGSVTWAQRILMKVSLNDQSSQLRSAHLFSVAMQWLWLSVNAIAFAGFAMGFYSSVSVPREYEMYSDGVAVSPWAALPLALYGVLLVVQALVFLDFSSRTVVPARVPWQPPQA
jgi:hypothetical protein